MDYALLASGLWPASSILVSPSSAIAEPSEAFAASAALSPDATGPDAVEAGLPSRSPPRDSESAVFALRCLLQSERLIFFFCGVMAEVTEGEKTVPGVVRVDGDCVKVASVAVVEAVEEEALAKGLVCGGGIWMCMSLGL